jgi:hypothetical protein
VKNQDAALSNPDMSTDKTSIVGEPRTNLWKTIPATNKVFMRNAMVLIVASMSTDKRDNLGTLKSGKRIV